MKRTKASASAGILPPPPNSKHQNGLILIKCNNNSIVIIALNTFYTLLGYSNSIDSQNDQAQLQILDEVNLQVVEQEQAIRQLEVWYQKYYTVLLYLE